MPETRSKISVNVEWCWGNNGEELTLYLVEGFQVPFIPESKKGHPDNWTPAEGGELEDLEIFDEMGGKIPDSVERELLHNDEFTELIQEELRG